MISALRPLVLEALEREVSRRERRHKRRAQAGRPGSYRGDREGIRKRLRAQPRENPTPKNNLHNLPTSRIIVTRPDPFSLTPSPLRPLPHIRLEIGFPASC